MTVSCREPGCKSVWYSPPHDFEASGERPPFLKQEPGAMAGLLCSLVAS